MALDKLTKVDGGGISTTSDYRVGIITATKFVGPIEGDVTGSITATDGTFSGNVTIGGTLTYEDVTNIDSVGIITARDGIHVGAGVSAVGVGTFGGLDINGDIDVDGHTNLDNVSIAGVTTFTSNIDANGDLDVNGTSQFQDDITLIDGYGNSNHVVYDKSQTALIFPSGPNSGTQFPAIIFGDRTSGGNTKFYNDYYNTHLQQIGEGGLIFSSKTNHIQINGANGSGGLSTRIYIGPGATEGVKLYQGANQLKFATVGYGVTVFGTTETQKLNVTGISTFSDDATFSKNINLPDSSDATDGRIKFGANDDMMLFHYGGANYIDVSTNLNIRGSSSGNTIKIRPKQSHEGITLVPDNSVSLYFANSKKLETSNTGVTVTGILTASQLILNDARSTLLASDSYNVLEMRADENNDGGNDDNIFKMTHDGTFRSEIRYDESENQLEISTVDNANHFCIGSTGDVKILKNVGIQTNDVTRTNLVGAGNSLVGMYIGDGSILFNKTLNRTGGYYISTEVNALNAGPVSLDATMTLDGTWTIV